MDSSEPVKILQISDTHLFADDTGRLMGINTGRTFDTVIDTVVSSGRQHDAVVVTGDISQDESKESYLRLEQGLQRLNAKAYCLPGNHDQGNNLQLALSHSKNISLDRCFVISNWQVILLNTSEPKRVAGHLNEPELEFLDNCLSKHPDHHALIAMHHQPKPVGSSWLDSISLDNPGDFFTVVDKHSQVRGIMYGHVHQKFEGKHNSVALMSAPSTCVQFKPLSANFAVDSKMPGYRWLRLHKDGRIESGVERISSQDIGLDKNSKGY